MSFLQPLLLLGLPLVALPLLVHLLHRRRHRTVHWGAMMFLLDAKRLSRGMDRLRFWLIMSARMLALAALIFAVGRPLASGWLGATIGGRPDTVILLLDRSASMEQQGASGRSKRETGVRKLVELTRAYGAGTRLVLVESTEHRALEIPETSDLLQLPSVGRTSARADIAGMLEATLIYMEASETGQTDIWICSDLRAGDWQPDDGRWADLRRELEARDGTRICLLSYPQPPSDNLAVSVTGARRRDTATHRELVLDFQLHSESPARQVRSVEVELVVNGARSVLPVEMVGAEQHVDGHVIPLDAFADEGWGRVALPGDENPADDVCYFVFSEPPDQHTLVVSDDPRQASLLELVATAPRDRALSYGTTVVTPGAAAAADWDRACLVLWQGPLPSGIARAELEQHVARGRPVIFFPPEYEDSATCFGVRWGTWVDAFSDASTKVIGWRGDSDLLRNTESGAALPLDEISVHRYRQIVDGGITLARLDGGAPLLTRVPTDAGAVYFCATLPDASHSNLAENGVVYYAAVQRALTSGAGTQGRSRHLLAGSTAARELASGERLSDPIPTVTQSAAAFHAGAWRVGDELRAIQRPPGESESAVVDSATLARLFAGLDFREVQDDLASPAPLASEVWYAFLLAMALALIAEAWLCLPDRTATGGVGERGQAWS